jgi:septal ring factor EnvC (AmiA/AmiB activator)
VELVKQYVLPGLRKQIELIKKSFLDLKEKLSLTKKTKTHVEQKIEEQQSTLDALEVNIRSWHDTLALKQVKLKKSMAELSTELQAKKQKQLAQVTLLKIQKSILPQAVADAKQELIKKYEKENGKKLLEKLLGEMR